MNRDTARAILAAAALMTAQVLLLAALAASTAHAETVYRCAGDASTSYQAQPCPSGNGAEVRTADARSTAQRAQAQRNHERQMAWLDQQQAQASPTSTPRASSKRRHKQRKAHGGSRQAAGPVAVPLTSHRIGERPFERLGQQVTPPDRRVHKRKRTPYEITARTPKTAQGDQQTKGGLKPAS